MHGWGRPLQATLFAIVSDELRADPERSELYLFAVPEGAQGRAISVAEALEPPFRDAAEAARTILLFPDIATARRLAEGGFPLSALNLGGLHHATGKHAVLPFVYLDAKDRADIRALEARGVRVTAQDLPPNPAHEAASFLGAE